METDNQSDPVEQVQGTQSATPQPRSLYDPHELVARLESLEEVVHGLASTAQHSFHLPDVVHDWVGRMRHLFVKDRTSEPADSTGA